MRRTRMNTAPRYHSRSVLVARLIIEDEKWHGRGRRFDPDQVHQFSSSLSNPSRCLGQSHRCTTKGRRWGSHVAAFAMEANICAKCRAPPCFLIICSATFLKTSEKPWGRAFAPQPFNVDQYTIMSMYIV
jgi:hypothetical protein